MISITKLIGELKNWVIQTLDAGAEEQNYLRLQFRDGFDLLQQCYQHSMGRKNRILKESLKSQECLADILKHEYICVYAF